MNISALLQRIFLLRNKASSAEAQNTAFESIRVLDHGSRGRGIHLSGESMEGFGQVKCNYPSWPWAKDSQSHCEARAKHKWVRPSSRIPSEELLLRQCGAP